MAHARVESPGNQFAAAGQFGMSCQPAAAHHGFRCTKRENIEGDQQRAHKRRPGHATAAEKFQLEAIKKGIDNAPGCQHRHGKGRADVSAPEEDSGMQNEPVEGHRHFEGKDDNGDKADGFLEETGHRYGAAGIDGDCSFARRCGDYHSPDGEGGEMQKTSWEKLEGEQLNKLVSRQMLSGDNATIARLLMTRGAVVPRHWHVSEQFSLILSGALKFVFDDQEVVVRGGEVLYIPANVPHSAVALEDTVDLDFFAPRREDWIRREDAYLREQRV